MKHQYHNPGTGIVKYVRTILSIEDLSDGDQLPVIPYGTSTLLYRVNEIPGNAGGASQLLLFGNLTGTHISNLHSGQGWIAYFFRPFVASALFGLTAQELKDCRLSLAEPDYKHTATLGKKLAAAKSVIEKIGMLDAFVLGLIAKNGPLCDIVQGAVDWMLNAPEEEPFSELPGKLHVTTRTLQRLFKKHVGVSANQFRRFCVFQAAFQQLRGQQFNKLADVAYEHGYADQSHFARSFKEFIDLTPQEYLKYGLPLDKK